MGHKTLVAYFSCSGVTKKVALQLSEVTGADIYEIVPKTLYTSSDLNWQDTKSRSTVEMRDPTSRPEISGHIDDMRVYDTIFVGFPIWWYVAPTIINTFLESYDFSGKTVILFATSGGSGFGRTVEKLKGSVAATTVLKEGKLLNGRPSDSDLRTWVKNFGL